MSIASATSKSGPYAGNGVTTVFAVAFACFAAADLIVVRTDASGIDTALTLITDYSVSLNADQTNSPGGTITMVVAPPTGYQLTILRNVAATQGTQLPNQGGWYPQVVEKALDKLTMLVQQLGEKVSRSVQVGVTGGDPSTLVAAINSAVTTSTAAASSASGSATAAAGSASAASGSAVAAAASAASINMPSIVGNALRPLRANAAASALEYYDIPMATAAEIKAGAIATKPLTPSATLAAQGFTAYVQTADQTITAAGALTIAHVLGRVPVLMQAFLRNTSAEFGYSIGDIVPVILGVAQTTTGYGLTVTPDATNLNIRFGSQATSTIPIMVKSSGAAGPATNASWSLFIRAWA